MNSHAKKYIIDTFDKIQGFNDSAFVDLKYNNLDSFSQDLSHSQTYVLHVASVIDAKEKNSNLKSEIIAELLSYADNLFELATSKTSLNPIEVKKNLTKNLKSIKTKFARNIVPKKEVVFMPCNSKMWDCFESVWKEFYSDDNYDTYVVVISYYDRNLDMTLGKYHYEIDEFPDYVNVTNHKDYPLEISHPDAIFIHNPYDDNNNVTTIDPAYYSSTLKNYTDMLVYIPYFLSYRDNIKPHSLTAPGVYRADKVIVDTEDIRQRYISEHMNMLKSYIDSIGEKKSQEFWVSYEKNLTSKFIALGSPKVDALFEGLNKTQQIPESWQDIIKDKKVIL